MCLLYRVMQKRALDGFYVYACVGATTAPQRAHISMELAGWPRTAFA